ncbi:MAG: SecDF P1 head subdomain-containing protein [Bacteriovoracaceae bacterium]
MSKNILKLLLVTSTLANITGAFAKDFKKSKVLQSTKQKKLELIPVKFSDIKTKDSLTYKESSLLPLTKKPIAVIEDFKYQTFIKEQAGIKVYIDEKSGKAIEKASKKYQGTKLAFVLDGKVLSAPQIKSALEGNEFELSFNNYKNFENVLSELNE